MNRVPLVVGLVSMLCSTTRSAPAQDAGEWATGTRKGYVQKEFASSNESYMEGAFKSNFNTLFSFVALYNIRDKLRFRDGLYIQEEVIIENGREQAKRFIGYFSFHPGQKQDLIKQ